VVGWYFADRRLCNCNAAGDSSTSTAATCCTRWWWWSDEWEPENTTTGIPTGNTMIDDISTMHAVDQCMQDVVVPEG
jgi:hypothetical protein